MIKILITILSCYLFICRIYGQTNQIERSAVLNREKRFVEIPGSGIGYLVAVAVPLQIKRHVFLAFDFEVNHGLPNNATYSPTALKVKWEGRENAGSSDPGKRKNSAKNKRRKNKKPKRDTTIQTAIGSFTRRNFYRVIKKHLFTYGMNGTSCLLKTICEANEIPLYEHNGLFGNIFHILFTPSASEDENLSQSYYDAEFNGVNGNCGHYQKYCSNSLLDLVTKRFIRKY